MSYINRYRKRVGQHGTSYKEIALNQQREELEYEFKNIYGHVEAVLNELEPIDLVIQSTTNNFTKSAMLRPSEKRVSSGAYLKFDDDFWIVRSLNKSRLSPVAELYYCNQRINFPNLKEAVPCYANSTTFGTKGVTDTDKFYELDSKTRLYIQDNEITKQLKLGYRFMFNHRAVYEITEIESTIYNGLLIITSKLVQLCEMDDLENNLAYNGVPLQPEIENTPPTPLQIVGEEVVKRRSVHRYQVIGATNGRWELDNPSLADLVVIDNGTVELQFKAKSDWLELRFTQRRQEEPIEVSVASLEILIS